MISKLDTTMHDSMKEFDCHMGAMILKHGRSLPDYWQHLHADANSMYAAQKNGISIEDLNAIEASNAIQMSQLSEVKNEDWMSLCTAAGWTVYGAVALSWCDGAELGDVWRGWLASGFPLKPLPEFERPARFLNPALLPQERSLEGINRWALAQNYLDKETYQLAVCAVIAALDGPLEMGLEPSEYETAAPQIAAFVKSRLLQLPKRSAAQEALIEVFNARIAGTEWDIWQEEVA